MSWLPRPRFKLVGLLVAGLLMVVASASGSTLGGAARTLDEACRAAAAEHLPSYPWPLKPFERQHPVRGYFGDPRTVVYGDRLGLFSFHNGVDISAWSGNAVYPVLSGVVARVLPDEVVVRSSHARRFQYIHLVPRVRPGQHVTRSRTVLGNVPRRWQHVHLTELRGSCVVNPLAPGHLSPYRDLTDPTVASISFSTPTGLALKPSSLHGLVTMVARAEDPPSLPGPGVWRRMPVAPALVRWSIRARHGRRVAGGTPVDFRVTEPPLPDFCRVYAPGTTQNFAADAGHYHWGRAGRYLYRLTPSPFNTATLPDGRYRLTVTASDTAGNRGSQTVTIQIDNDHRPTATPRALSDWRCSSRALTDARVRAFRDLRQDRPAAQHDSLTATSGSSSALTRARLAPA